MATIEKLINLCGNDLTLLGAVQELEQLRKKQRLEIKSATKFLGNSQFKQLCHMTSELWEVWKAWIVYKRTPNMDNRRNLASEIVDLQSSSQTMLEGPMYFADDELFHCRLSVQHKNDDRGYYDLK